MIYCSHVVAKGFGGIIPGNIFNGAIWSVFDTIFTSICPSFFIRFCNRNNHIILKSRAR